jgi:NAD+ synthase
MSEQRLRHPARLREYLVDWLRQVRSQGAMDGFIFGLSGGIDSAVVCGLAAEAVGAESCLGVVLPVESHPEDAELARQVADRFGVRVITVDLTQPFRTLVETLADYRERAARPGEAANTPPEGAGHAATVDALALANVKPRLRMLALYYYANLLRYLVLGTGNRDEIAVGYFTKYGDGGADAFPLADLVKAEVRALARELGVPDAVVERPPSAGLWPGQTDEAELGFSYDQLDRYLLEGSSGDAAVDAAIRHRQDQARHKLSPPPAARPE